MRAFGWFFVVLGPMTFGLLAIWGITRGKPISWLSTTWSDLAGVVFVSVVSAAFGWILCLGPARRTNRARITTARIVFGEFAGRWNPLGLYPRSWPTAPELDTRTIVSCEWHSWPMPGRPRALPVVWRFTIETRQQGHIRLSPSFEPFQHASAARGTRELAEMLQRQGVPTVIVEHPEDFSFHTVGPI